MPKVTQQGERVSRVPLERKSQGLETGWGDLRLCPYSQERTGWGLISSRDPSLPYPTVGGREGRSSRLGVRDLGFQSSPSPTTQKSPCLRIVGKPANLCQAWLGS